MIRRRKKSPETDLMSIGNIVARLFGVSLLDIWETAKDLNGAMPLGKMMVQRGLITEQQLRKALDYQRAHRATVKDVVRMHKESARELSAEMTALKKLMEK